MPWLAAALVAAPLLVGCGAPSDATSAPRAATEAIARGAADAADPEVVALTNGTRAFCTGTLVSPRAVVTAAHCLESGPPATVYFGPSVGIGEVGESRSVAAVFAHPNYVPATLANDIAVVILAGKAPAGVAASALPTAPLPLAVGLTVRVAGFGLDGPAIAGAAVTTGIKRAGTASIAAIDADTLATVPSPSQPCSGDSGGPVFLAVGSAEVPGEVLAGVTSSGDPACDQRTTFTRLDGAEGEFVRAMIARAAPGSATSGSPCIDDSSCVNGKCYAPSDAPHHPYCTRPCEHATDCPNEMICGVADGARACVLPMPSPFALGARCGADSACDSLDCAALGEVPARCASPCAPGGITCAGGAACLADARHPGGFACAEPATPTQDRAGCAAAPAAAGDLTNALSLLCALALAHAFRARRRPR